MPSHDFFSFFSFCKIHITKNGLQEFNGVEPISFISYEFFEHELQATPVSQGVR